jgi:putative flippase GtrA
LIDRARTLFFELFRFGIVGVIGLLINIFVVYAARPVLNLQLCGVLGFLVAATGTWVLHRNFTFKPISTKPAPIYRQWLAFLTVNAAGGGTYILVFYVLTDERESSLPQIPLHRRMRRRHPRHGHKFYAFKNHGVLKHTISQG